LNNTPDIDIDLPGSFNMAKTFPTWVRASLLTENKLTAHPCGYYPQNIPQDPYTKLSAIPYEMAEEIGFQKLDFLHVTVYDHFKSREEIEELVKIEPNWDLLLLPSVSTKLFQLAKHSDMLQSVKPKSILELADVLALIRPGKRNLLNLYLKDRVLGRQLLYSKGKDGSYGFKKAHAVSYAMVVVLQLHLVSMDLF